MNVGTCVYICVVYTVMFIIFPPKKIKEEMTWRIIEFSLRQKEKNIFKEKYTFRNCGDSGGETTARQEKQLKQSWRITWKKRRIEKPNKSISSTAALLQHTIYAHIFRHAHADALEIYFFPTELFSCVPVNEFFYLKISSKSLTRRARCSDKIFVAFFFHFARPMRIK